MAVEVEATLRVYFSYDSDNVKKIFYLILLDLTLYVIDRKNMEPQSDLRLIKSITDCREVKIVELPGRIGQPVVFIDKLDGEVIHTNFIDDVLMPITTSWESVDSHPDLDQMKDNLELDIQTRKQFVQTIEESISARLRFGPTELQCGPRSEEIVVRYGDTWRRIHNDMIVIGAPILNTGLSRQVFIAIMFIDFLF